ncbi:PHF20 [Mytilus edulis]|uniref:PHF20 n=1 Tax=Mytilus edulis TaxID=6550 RepID=A0A8S3V887_MYTED|nr:PHF20 [Mytilus edulis]
MIWKRDRLIMREQHPQNQSITFLPTGNQQWRKKCMNVLQYDKEKMGPFDSSFREQIFVSALPTSCFDLVEELDQSFKDGHVRTSFKKTLMTGGVFQCLEKEEEDSAMKEIELVRLRREVHRLKAENRRLTTILMENSQEKETKTVEPEVQTVGPEDQTVEPEVQTVEPEVQTVEPEDQTDEPEVSSPSVGGLVMARWTPDKVYYEAKVLSVTKRCNKCILYYFSELNCKGHNGWLQEDISSEVFEATLI